MISPEPRRESSEDSITVETDAGNRGFLHKISVELKKHEAKVSCYSRLSLGVEIPILVLSSINVSALVSTFFVSDGLEVAGKALSLALTTLSLILLGTKKLLDPERRREKALQLRNRLSTMKLQLVDAIAHENVELIKRLKIEAMDIISSLED